jgi:hypothetical protein
MDNFCALALHNPPHDIDGGIMAVKQGSGRYDPYRMILFVRHFVFLTSMIQFNYRKLEGTPFRFAKLQLKKGKKSEPISKIRQYKAVILNKI